MAIGPFIRQLLGPFEKPASELYRAIFVDLSALARQIKDNVPAENILEIGCGEGALIERLANIYPQAHLAGIDITPRVGRMFQGDFNQVIFQQKFVKEFVAQNKSCFDLVVISDVLHHIPWGMHQEFLTDSAKALKPGGCLVLKDWESRSTPIHLLCYLADRYITGDQVQYKTLDQLRILTKMVFGEECIKKEVRVRPWSNNIVFFVQF
ncbi:MAG TPA: class I SAM-dependent methyltransferase [Candidatus Competibacteraceae bacterium]|nr:class I SAM-dependent methyltransferase [Candidatus Competibacteraceae bacterium]